MEAAETDTFLLGDRVIMHNAFEANILLTICTTDFNSNSNDWFLYE